MYNPILMPNVDLSQVFDLVVGETKYTVITDLEQLQAIDLNSYFDYKPFSRDIIFDKKYILLALDGDVLDCQTLPYNKGFYKDRNQIKFGNIIKITGQAYESLLAQIDSDDIIDDNQSNEEFLRNLYDKNKYHYASYLNHPLVYEKDIQLNEETREFECALAFIKDKISPDEFWDLKNSIVSIPAKQFQKDTNCIKFVLDCIETKPAFHIYSANAKELGMPYHKYLASKVTISEKPSDFMHGNVIRFEGKAKN